MTEPNAGGLVIQEEKKLSPRDRIILPLLGLLTIAAMVMGTWSIASGRFHASASTTLPCLILNDPTTGVRAIPNTVCWQKSLESDMAEYRFNSCGHRDGAECGPKPPGTYRIVMIGSSFNYGMFVAREKSFAALLQEQLSLQHGRRIELYNEAMQRGFPASAALRFNQVFAEQPDLILWVLTPTDIASTSMILPYIAQPVTLDNGNALRRNWHHIKVAFSTHSIPGALAFIWDRSVASVWIEQVDQFRASPSGVLLQHVLYSDRNLYLKSYLMGANSESGFLRLDQGEDWRNNLREFDRAAAAIEKQSSTAGVPLVASLVPNRAQAAMISMGQWPVGYDPYKLDNELRAIIVSHGGIYIDILPDFRAVPNPERHYFPVDGHPDAAGHAMIAGLLAKELTSGAVPALMPAGEPQLTSAKGQ